MATSGKTTKLEWPYPLTTDKPPDGPANFKAQAERAEAIFVGTSGQVLIDQSTGVPAPKTLKGDATLAADGTLSLAKPIIVGNVTAAGGVGAGSGFSVERTETGIYKVTLTTELATNAIIVVTLAGAGGFFEITSPFFAKKVFGVRTFASSSSPANIAFNFMIKAT